MKTPRIGNRYALLVALAPAMAAAQPAPWTDPSQNPYLGLVESAAASPYPQTPYPQTSTPYLAPGLPAPEAVEPLAAAEPPVVAPIPVEEPTPAAEPTPAEVIEAVEAAADGPVLESGEEIEAIEVAEEEVSWWRPYSWLRIRRWDTAFEFGLNGASGTSESLSFRTGGYIKRETDRYKLDTSLYYNRNTAEGVEVQSNALLDARYDFLFADSPWTLFVLTQTFYDEFQAFDINVNVNTGVGYQWIDEDWLKLTTSLGSGASREFGDAVDDEWVPEASLGVNYEQMISDSHRFYAKADYFPRWEDPSIYRVVADIGLEIDLPDPSNLTLKFSATDRFDSNPSGAEPHNFNYSAALLWKL